MITVEVNGSVYQGFTSVEVENLFFSISNAAVVHATSSVGYPFPIQNQSQIRILVEGTPVLNGYVDEIDVSYNQRDHQISFKARDHTSDIIDSQLGPGLEFVAPITLQQVVQQVVNYLGIPNVNVLTNSNIAPFTEADKVSCEIGQKGFDFIDAYCRKRQVFATTDGNSNIILTEAQQIPITTVLFNQVGKGSNIVSASVRYASVERFNSYICHSQGNGSTEIDSNSLDQGDISGFNGTAIDNQVRPTRVCHFIAETSCGNQDCVNRAIWEANFRRSSGFTYNCKVQGHIAVNDGIIWAPNMLVTVIDEFCNINSQLLIAKVRYSYSVDGGDYTTLELVTRDAFTLQAEQNPRSNIGKTNTSGEEFNNLEFDYSLPGQDFVGPLPEFQ